MVRYSSVLPGYYYPSSQCYGPTSSDRGSQPFYGSTVTVHIGCVITCVLLQTLSPKVGQARHYFGHSVPARDNCFVMPLRDSQSGCSQSSTGQCHKLRRRYFFSMAFFIAAAAHLLLAVNPPSQPEFTVFIVQKGVRKELHLAHLMRRNDQANNNAPYTVAVAVFKTATPV